MVYDVKTPEEYLQALDDDWRKEKLLILRSMILAAADDIVEGIGYKMLSYADANGVILHLNAQMGYVSLYVGDASKVDPEGHLLAGINVGKGCLRFKKTLKPEETRVNDFIIKAIGLWKQGKDIDC